jgi:hypothetical protein
LRLEHSMKASFGASCPYFAKAAGLVEVLNRSGIATSINLGSGCMRR